jgi:hypothetical protein
MPVINYIAPLLKNNGFPLRCFISTRDDDTAGALNSDSPQ